MILVTGGAGFIGANFVLDWLAQHNEPVVNLDSLTYAGNLETLAGLQGNPAHIFVQGDIADAALAQRLLSEHQPLLSSTLRLWQLLAASVAVTVVLAFLSWHLVEKPALRLKPRRRRIAPQIAEAGSPYQVDPAPLVMQAMVQVLGNR